MNATNSHNIQPGNTQGDGLTILPGHLVAQDQVISALRFVPYASSVPVVRGKSSLKQHLISLITEGQKIIHAGDQSIHVTPANILLLDAGNYLFTERLQPDEYIKSTMVFFDDSLLQKALSQVSDIMVPPGTTSGNPFVLFPKDDYLHRYISSIQELIKSGLFTASLQQIKLQELLVYLCSKYPDAFASFGQATRVRPDEERIKQVIETGNPNELTIAEIAFLCNMSLPTFKRKFAQLYSQSPGQWLQQRRLQKAADLLLRKGAKPAEVYLEAGYENHSSFSKAFKAHFGVLPRDYSTMSH